MKGIANGASSHPAFAYGTGLDARLWCFLHEAAPRTTSELAQLTGTTRSTLRARLTRIEHAGLARRDENGAWRRIGDTSTLDRIADERGITDRAERRAARHHDERQRHRTRPPVNHAAQPATPPEIHHD